MAMIKCPECNGDVSSEAFNCPICGCPLKKEKKNNGRLSIKLVIIILAIVLLIGFVLVAIKVYPQYAEKKRINQFTGEWEITSMETARGDDLSFSDGFVNITKDTYEISIESETRDSGEWEFVKETDAGELVYKLGYYIAIYDAEKDQILLYLGTGNAFDIYMDLERK